jgi:hypothetical protein
VLAIGAFGEILVQCGDAPICITRHVAAAGTPIPVGARLGYVADAELASLRLRVAELERLLTREGGSEL